MLLGVVEMVRTRRLAWIPLALVVLSPLCVLASPYGTKLVAYYDLMLVDAPFAADPARVAVVEPERDDRALLAPRARRGRDSSRCDAAAAGSRSTSSPSSLVTFVGRGPGRPWGHLVRARRRGDSSRCPRRPPHQGRRRRAARQPHRSRSSRSPASRSRRSSFVARPASWFVSEWPETRAVAVREATRDPRARALGNGRHRRLAPLAHPGPAWTHRLRRPLRALRRGDDRATLPLRPPRGSGLDLAGGRLRRRDRRRSGTPSGAPRRARRAARLQGHGDRARIARVSLAAVSPGYKRARTSRSSPPPATSSPGMPCGSSARRATRCRADDPTIRGDGRRDRVDVLLRPQLRARVVVLRPCHGTSGAGVLVPTRSKLSDYRALQGTIVGRARSGR